MSKKLECRNLKKSYNEFTLDVDFSINSGDFVTILGPSGCGKTTLLQLISGFIQSDEGQIIIDSNNMDKTPINKRGIAYVFQDYCLFDHLNVFKNISYSKTMRKKKRAERKLLVSKYLDLVNLNGYENRKINSLSGGEKQRVAIARALASESKLLLLDEPLSALDFNLRNSLKDIIKNIHKTLDLTIIYVTHDQKEALSLSDKVLLLNNGKIEQYSNPQELYEKPRTLFTANFISTCNILDDKIFVIGEDDTFYSKTKKDIVFRIENVIIHEDLSKTFPEFLPHLVFEDALMIDQKYEGNVYYYTFKWNDIILKASSQTRVSKSIVSLGVKKRDLLLYENGVLTKSKLSLV